MLEQISANPSEQRSFPRPAIELSQHMGAGIWTYPRSFGDVFRHPGKQALLTFELQPPVFMNEIIGRAVEISFLR
jgi:hypothetical protein